jgi:uncharacterized protein
MILVDANILMYAAGAEHPYKQPSVLFLEEVAGGSIDAVVDAEVLQEVLHRYRAIARWHDGRTVYDRARTLFQEVLPITAEVVDAARATLDEVAGISARDALHAAVVRIWNLDGLCSYDRGFDGIPGVRRVEPPSAS